MQISDVIVSLFRPLPFFSTPEINEKLVKIVSLLNSGSCGIDKFALFILCKSQRYSSFPEWVAILWILLIVQETTVKIIWWWSFFSSQKCFFLNFLNKWNEHRHYFNIFIAKDRFMLLKCSEHMSLLCCVSACHRAASLNTLAEVLRDDQMILVSFVLSCNGQVDFLVVIFISLFGRLICLEMFV